MSKALEYMKSLIAAGWEYPDAQYKAATRFRVSADELQDEYDRASGAGV